MERKTYKGLITELKENQIFVFGSNPEGRHGKGAAKIALNYGAKYGQGRGLQGNAYGLVTKNLRPGYYEKETGIKYNRYGPKSLSITQIIKNMKDLYELAITKKETEFMVVYTSSGRNLNGYTASDMANMFRDAGPIPDNIVFEEIFSKLVFTEKE